MAVVPLNARSEYGLCLFSHTMLISFGYSHRLCFPTSNYGWQLVAGVLWIPYVLCKTAEKRIHALHINMPKCQESPLSIKTIRNRKEKCLASSLVNVGLSEKLSVEICVSYCWVLCVRNHHVVLLRFKHYPFLPCSRASGLNIIRAQNWMTLKVNLSFAVGFH